MQVNKKRVVVLLISALIISLFAGCSGGNSQKNSAGTSVPEIKEPFTIIDQMDNEVLIPGNVERVVITSIFPLPSVYSLFQGSGEGVVGIHPGSKSAAVYSILPRVAPQLLNAETNFIKGTEVNIEELLKLSPDIVYYRGENTAEYEIYQKAGIPAAAFTTLSAAGGNSLETLNGWLQQLGDIYQREDRAQEIIDYGYEVLNGVQSRVSTLPEEQKVRALFLFRYSESEIIVAGKGHFGDWWLQSTGAINVASEVNGAPAVNMEQIYQWNPDKIYITNFSPHLPVDLFDNVVPNHNWAPVKAIIDKEVHKVPLGMYRWYPPSSDAPLMLMWLAQKNYPHLFEDIDMNKEVTSYFEKFYGVTLTSEDLTMIFNPRREAAQT